MMVRILATVFFLVFLIGSVVGITKHYNKKFQDNHMIALQEIEQDMSENPTASGNDDYFDLNFDKLFDNEEPTKEELQLDDSDVDK